MIKNYLKQKKEHALGKKISRQREKDTEVLRMCRRCFAFDYGDDWHFERPKYLLEENNTSQKISVEFSQCPSCVEESLAMYDMEYI